MLHTTYWKYVVRRRVTRDASLRFVRSPSNWPAVPPQETAWELRADIALLRQEHILLRQAIAAVPARQLDRRARDSRWTLAELIHAIAAHDLYHAGQIQLLKRLQTGRPA